MLAPALVEGQELPLDVRRKVTQDGLGGRVDVQCGGDEVETRRLRGERDVAEVSVALELAGSQGETGGRVSGREVVVADADPVVEALECEVEVVVGFELDDGEAAIGGDAEQVEEAAVGGAGDGGDLRVDVGGVEARDGAGDVGWFRVGAVAERVGIVWGGRGAGCGREAAGERGEVAAEDGLEPALGGGAIERILRGAGVCAGAVLQAGVRGGVGGGADAAGRSR